MYIEIGQNLVLHCKHLKVTAKAPNAENILLLYFPYTYEIYKLIEDLLKVSVDFIYVYHNKIGFYNAYVIKDINEYIEEHEGVVTILHDYQSTNGASIEHI